MLIELSFLQCLVASPARSARVESSSPRIATAVPRAVITTVHACARANGSTVFTVLLAAYQALLH
ncbi:hypothetical protein K2Z84_02255, partial [Candidatus Binatia bacterium]|nr:hypothetical protein [Candidatus Binatia bacterium]